jgi:ribose transport system substrate-binding protein
MSKYIWMIGIFVFVLLLVFVVIYEGDFSNVTGKNKKSEIYVIMKSNSDNFEFWQIVKNGAEAASKEFDANVIIDGTLSEEDIDGQIAIVDKAINRNPDVIVLAALDYERLVEPAQKVLDNDINLITMDSGIAQDLGDCFIATNSYRGGIFLADAMAAKLQGKGSILLISHSTISESSKDRVSGFLDGLKRYPDLVPYGDIFDSKDMASISYAYTERFLREKGDQIDGIFATNQISSEGVCAALSESEYVDDIVVYAFDSSVKQNEFLANGVIDGLIVQQPFNMGYACVKNAIDLAKGVDIPHQIYIDFKYITRENMYEEENLKLLFPFSD